MYLRRGRVFGISYSVQLCISGRCCSFEVAVKTEKAKKEDRQVRNRFFTVIVLMC